MYQITMTKRNFNILWGFWIAEKELAQKKTSVRDIIMKYYQIGVEEFFLGYNPPYWHSQYAFSVSPNGRFWENEQISSFETLKEAVEIIHSLKRQDGENCKVLLTMNGWQYSDLAFPLMERMLAESNQLEIDGLIIGNFEWMQHLAEVGYKGRISISTILNTYSAEAVQFWLEFGQANNLNIYRIVLPREITLKEMKDIIPQFPAVNFEVFGQGDFCRYANGNCFAEHKYFSRDLCTFVLKQGMDIKKRIQYNFKNIVLNENYSEGKKQYLLDPRLDAIDYNNNDEYQDLQYLFVGNPLLETSHPLFDKYLLLTDVNYYQTINSKDRLFFQRVFEETFKELMSNEIKYYYDPLQPESSPHNKNVLRYNHLFGNLLAYLERCVKEDGNIPLSLQKLFDVLKHKFKTIQYLIERGQNYFKGEIQKRGTFGLETYYKFMLYNRTSLPYFEFFNTFPNIDVVKIPLRGRDASVFKLGLQLIDDAIEYPEKYLNTEHQSYRYLHYQPLTKIPIELPQQKKP